MLECRLIVMHVAFESYAYDSVSRVRPQGQVSALYVIVVAAVPGVGSIVRQG
jgi:hypothetical protein